jgi:hypothetical protein
MTPSGLMLTLSMEPEGTGECARWGAPVTVNPRWIYDQYIAKPIS